MSTRGNIIMRFNEGSDIYFYQHCDGYDIGAIAQRALARKERWNDESYLARIIFSEMIKNNIDGETGFGISPYPTDNNVDYLIIDCPNQQVIRAEEKESKIGKIKKIWSFEEFIKSKSVAEWYCL